MRILILLLSAFLLASCGSPRDPLEDRLGELVRAKDRWVEHAGDRPYTYTLQRGQTAPCTVAVTEPGLLRSDWMEYQSESDGWTCRVNPTMRELFQLVLDVTGEQLTEEIALEVEYDENLGFPKRIYIEYLDRHDAFGTIIVSDIVFEDGS